MPNVNLTVDWIGNEALRLAHEKASFLGTINREFDASFRPGYGNVIRIRVPSQYTVTDGRVIDVQDSVQQSTSITVATQSHVALRYNSQELAQDLVNFQKLHLEPAMAQLVSYIEASTIARATEATFNLVGVAGSAITTLLYPGQARARLNQMLAPKDRNRSLQMDSVTMSEMINGVAAYFAPQNAIAEQYREGFIARTAMADYYENERVYSMVNASTSPAVLSTYTITDPDTSFTVSNVVTVPSVGQVFEVGAGASAIYPCHPETKEGFPYLQRFVITAATTSTFTFSPTIRLTGARKNVSRANGDDLITSSLTSAAITFVGAVSSTYPQPLMYHRDAFTFATAALPIMDDAIRCVVKTYDGISLRVWEASDIRNDEKLTRIDILWGFAAIRPQWACRLIGTGA